LFAACAAPPTPIFITATPPPPPTATPVPTATSVPTAVPGVLFVDAAEVLGPISPYVYGTNYGPWLFVPLEMQPAAEAARLRFISFPGGNWGDRNDVDHWQVDQFIQFCRQVGAEPRIVVRLRGGTPEMAAALVQYANQTQGYNVRYWGIGNEANLYPDYELDQYLRDWRAMAEAMRAVDPAIQLIGPDTNQFEARPTSVEHQKANDWLAAFLRANGDLLDVVSVHRYPFPLGVNAGPPSIPQLRANSAEWDEAIPALRALVRQHAGRDLPLAVTEINSSWAANRGGEATLESHFNAIWWADVLGRLIRQDVYMVAQFAIIGDFGLMGRFEVYPIYHVYSLFQRFGAERVYAASGMPNVSVFAARRPDGALTLMLVNLESQPVSAQLQVARADLSAPAETWLFDAGHPAEQAPPTPLGAGPLNLPPESVQLFILPQP
jgi:hypothetical protein